MLDAISLQRGGAQWDRTSSTLQAAFVEVPLNEGCDKLLCNKLDKPSNVPVLFNVCDKPV
jgi:hypothetical protein